MKVNQITKRQLVDELAAKQQQIEELEKEARGLRSGKEHTLRKNKAILRSIYLATAVGIGIVTNRIIEDVNDKLCEMTGYEAGELVGSSARILYPTDAEFENVGREIYAQIAKKQTGMVETRWLHKDGSIINILLSSTPIDPGDHTAGITFTALDITERREAEDALRVSEQRYRQLAELLQEGIWMLDSNAVTTYVNPRMAEMLGYSVDEMLGQSLFSFIDEKKYETITKHIENRKQGLKEHYDFEFNRKDGRQIFTSLASCPLKDSNGAYMGSLIGVTDVTARRHAEDLYKTLVEKSFAGVYIIQDGIIKFINEIIASYSGYSTSDAIGAKALDFIHPQDKTATKTKAQQMLRGKCNAPYEFRIITKDGNFRWIMETVNPIVYDGKPAVLCNCMDITDFKDAVRKVEEHELLESTILDTIPDAVLGLRERRIIFANKGAERVFGWKPEELIGKDTSILYRSTEEYARIGRTVYSSLENNAHCQMEMCCRHKDGREILCQFYTTVIGDHLCQDKVVAVYEDITAKRKEEQDKISLENQLRQSQKMEAIGTLAGGIAHDFNNILGAIIGNTEMALMDLKSDTHLEKYLRRLCNASERATDLVKQILTFSRQDEKAMQPLKISPLIKEVMKLIRASLPSSIRIQQEISAYPDMVLADPTQIHQVIMNLSTNAAHAMRAEGGTLKISLTNLDVKADELFIYPVPAPGSYLKLTVSDTGHGMEPSVQERIFEPFFTTKKQGEGTGMGLSVVHGIAKNHGGALTVESEPAKGSSFHVFLPALQEEGGSITDEAKGAIPRGTERVLFVDDEADLVSLAEDMLTRLGYKVVGQTDSMEALHLFNMRPELFDIVITDQTMPNLTGKELAKKLIGIRPDIPIILCTGYQSEIASEGKQSPGISESILKPVARRTIAEAIRRALDRKE